MFGKGDMNPDIKDAGEALLVGVIIGLIIIAVILLIQ